MSLDTEFILSELIKSGSAALNQNLDNNGNVVVNTSINSDGETFGYVERPIYNEQQLVKAVDVIVDELISPDQNLGPQTVLKTTYDDLEALYKAALQNIKDLQKQLDDANLQIQNLNNQIDDLNREVDLQKLLKSSADNERDAISQNLQQVSMDLQAALVKGTKEAVERVSREASLQGALAEKEAFKQLREDYKKSLDDANANIKTLNDDLTRAQMDFNQAVSNFLGAK